MTTSSYALHSLPYGDQALVQLYHLNWIELNQSRKKLVYRIHLDGTISELVARHYNP